LHIYGFETMNVYKNRHLRGQSRRFFQSATPMLLTYPRMYVRRLSGEFSGAICMDAN
jgi:hypothetical protein